ncbi:hypothetical protein MITS9509_02459 [Synechococcus sp. MIT S9509]|nr:hypothetical protein MITS9504_02279 [Synechococcus sp. MIT S9504]KZR91523.1 hypothetical protein MITS9509_02459 [Synechococcus sp. MIT S9509]
MMAFAKEIEVGDGYSSKRTEEIFNQNFKDATPDEIEASQKCFDHDRWTEENQEHKIWKPDLLAPVPEGQQGHGVFVFKHPNTITFMCGLWAVVLALTDEAGKRHKYPVWTLGVKTGKRFRCSPSGIRGVILDQFDEETYAAWKQLVMSNKEGAYEALASACDWLGHKKKVGLSYISGRSSMQLLTELGIRCERDHAFLYPHYKKMFEEKLLNETRSEYEQWLKQASNEHREMFKQMVANTKRQNPRLTEAAARQQVMITLHEMGVMT